MPAFWLSLAFISGIWLGSALQFKQHFWFTAAAAALPFLLLPAFFRYLVVNQAGMVRTAISRCTPRQLTRLLSPVNRLRSLKVGIAIPWFAVVLCLGAVRYQAALPSLSAASVSAYNDLPTQVVLEGTLIEPPEVREGYVNLVVRTEN